MHILIFLLLTATSPAATYSFYFNNTEQGANSSATPSLTTAEKKSDNKDSGEPVNQSIGRQPEINAAEAPEDTTPTDEKLPEAESTFRKARWKIALGFTTASHRWHGPSYLEKEPTFTEPLATQGSLTYYLTSDLGISALAGRLSGLEIELSPLGAPIGWGRPHLALTVGVLKDLKGHLLSKNTGWSAGPRDLAEEEGQITDYYGDRLVNEKPLNVYAGAQLGVNIIRNVAAIAAYRISPIAKHSRRLSTATVTLNYLF